MEANPSKPTLMRRFVLLLALIPCLTAFAFELLGPRANACAPPENRPALAFDQYAVNLGPIDPMGLAKARFRFTNLSDGPVTITELRPSCGCLQPRLEKQGYAPGETGQFIVQVATAGEMPGPREYTITMEYQDPTPQSVTLTFRLELPERQLYITPRAVLVYQFGDEPVTRDILITDNRAKPATVTGVESSANYVSTQLAGTTENDDGVQSTLIKVTVSGIQNGTQNTLLKVFTDDPKFPVLKVPVRVQRQPPVPPAAHLEKNSKT